MAKRAYRVLLRLSDWVSYAILATMAVVVSVDVLCRYFLGFSTQVAEEVASLGLVTLMFVSLAGAFDDGSFLRIDAFYARTSGRLKRSLDVLFHLLAVGVTVVYCIFVGKLVLRSYATGVHADSYLATPNYLPQAAMLFGLCALLVAIVAGLIGLKTRAARQSDV